MRLNFVEQRQMSGHLEITKVFRDGSTEVVLDDHNVIVSGMSVGLSHFFTLSGSQNITDYHLDRFQLGVSGPPTGGAVSSIYELSGPLNSVDEYGGTAADLFIEEADQIKNGSVVSNSFYGLIPFSHVTRIDDTSVRYTIVVDEDAANDLDRGDGASNTFLNEIGLFMKNPRGQSGTNASLLVAYRTFSNIQKTTDFSLVFRWTINF